MRNLTLLFLALACLLGCGAPTAQAAVTAAEVANEIARRGTQVYAVSIDACHAAELVAVDLPSIETARATVAEIRERCDQAFDAIEGVRKALEAMDAVVAQASTGVEAARSLAAAALAARDAVEHAERVNRELAAYLEGIK